MKHSSALSPNISFGTARLPARRRRRAIRLRRHARAYVFLVPSVTILLVFVGYPIVQSFWMSLHNWSFFATVQPYVGLQNYENLWHDSRFWGDLRNTAIYTGAVVPLQVCLGLALAVALQRNTFINKFFRSVYFFPVISSLATMGIVWKFLLDPTIGIITHAMVAVGLPDIDFLREHDVGASGGDPRRGVEKRRLFHGDLPCRPSRRPRVIAGGGHPRRGGTMGAVPPRGTADAPAEHAVLLGHSNDRLHAAVRLGLRHDRRWPDLPHRDPCHLHLLGGLRLLANPGYAAALSWVLFVLILAISMLQLRLFRYREVN